MSTTIRLTRAGRAKRPFYRLVVVDSRDRRDGAFIENLGTYNPIPALYECEIKADRAIEWLNRGATLSDTARSLLRNEGVLFRWHLEKAGAAPEDVAQKVDEFRAGRSRKVDDQRAQMKQERDEKARKYAEQLAAKKAAAAAPPQKEAEEPAEASAAEDSAEEAAVTEEPAAEADPGGGEETA